MTCPTCKHIECGYDFVGYCTACPICMDEKYINKKIQEEKEKKKKPQRK